MDAAPSPPSSARAAPFGPRASASVPAWIGPAPFRVKGMLFPSSTAPHEAEMTDLLRILTYPDPFLRRPAVAVAEITDDVRTHVERMIETMHQARGIGLAATQVGWNARVAIVSGAGVRGEEIALINPEIVEVWGSEAMEEGCLSFPGVSAVITRAHGVLVRYTGLDGEVHEVEDEEMLGRCILHEFDHLNGITFLSKMSPADKLANRRALKALEARDDRRTA